MRQKAAPGQELSPVLGRDELSLRMVGKHQVQNAAAAASVALQLQAGRHAALGPAQVRAGLENAHLPGRFSLTARTQAPTGVDAWLLRSSCIVLLECGM